MKPKDFQDRFIDAFADAVKHKNLELTEEYISMMCDVAAGVWLIHGQGDEAVYSLKQLQTNCRKVFDSFAQSDSADMKIMCLKFICKVYGTLYQCILGGFSDASYADKGRQYFQILDWTNVHIFLERILREVDIKALHQNEISIPGLLVDIQIVDFTLATESAKEFPLQWMPDYAVTYIQLFMGWYLIRQRHNIMPGDDSYYEKFTRDFITSILPHSESPKVQRYLMSPACKKRSQSEAQLKKGLCIGNALYVCGLIKEGLSSEAENVFRPKKYADDVYCSGSIEIQNALAVYILIPLCYLYYAGFCDNGQNTKKDDVIASARRLSKNLSDQYKDILKRGFILDLLIVELNKSHYLAPLMKQIDTVPDSVVRDFCLFSLLFAEKYLMIQEILRNEEGRQIDNMFWLKNAGRYIDYVIKGNATDDKILNFITFMGIKEAEPQTLARSMSEKLKREISLKYKSEIQPAENSAGPDKVYIAGQIEKLREKTRALISEKFGDAISINSTDEIEYRSAGLLDYCVYSRSLDAHLENDIDFMANSAYLNLTFAYIQEMIRSSGLQHIEYDKIFSTDHEYLAHLEREGLDLMLGSRWLLVNRDISQSDIFDERTKDYRWITADGSLLGAAVKSSCVHFYVKNIKASVDDAKFSDMKHAIKQIESGSYEYEVIDGFTIPFDTEKELTDYIGREKKIIRVRAEIAIKTHCAGNLGIYFDKR